MPTIIGIGIGRNRPTITAHASAVDCFNVTAANVHLENFRIVGATSCTALLNTSTAGDDLECVAISFEHGAAPLSALTVNGDRASFINCRWLGTANGPDYGITAESTASDYLLKDCIFNYGVYGLDVSAIYGGGDPIAECEGWLIHNCQFIGIEGIAIDFNSSSNANVATLVVDCAFGMGADTADIDAACDLASAGFVNVLVTDNPDSRGRHIPVTTPA